MRIFKSGHSGFFCMLFLLSACSGDSDEALEFDPLADQYDADAYNIGMLPLYPYRRDAGLLAAELINRGGGLLGGKRLNVIGVSYQTADAALSIDVTSTVRSMIDDYGLQVLTIGSSSLALEISRITVPAQVLLLADSATSPALTTLEDDDWFFRVPPSDALEGRLLAQLVWEQGTHACNTIFAAGDSYGEELTAEFAATFRYLGGEIGAEVALPPERTNGFYAWFDDIFGNAPECVFPVMVRSTTLANLLNEAAGADFQGRYLFSDAALAQGFNDSLANPLVLRNSIAITPGFGLRDSAEYRHFADLYRVRFRQEPLNYAVYTYDLVMVLALAIERAGREYRTAHPDARMVRDSLRAVMNPPGTPVSPTSIHLGLALLRDGGEVDFSGASNSAMGWDANGDVTGRPVYDVYVFSEETRRLVPDSQFVIEIP